MPQSLASTLTPCLLSPNWIDPDQPGDILMQPQGKVWVRAAWGQQGGTHRGTFFSHAYVPSQAALSEPGTMCSFCPQPFQPPVHSLCICCHTGHPGWQATTGTHCAALMKHGAGDTGVVGACRGWSEQRGTPCFYIRLLLEGRATTFLSLYFPWSMWMYL